jgi:hypothetical protein
VANQKFDMGDYKEVAIRIQDFRQQYPDGTIQSEIVPTGFDGVHRGEGVRLPDS